ncbi:MAG: YbaN family protein [Pseudomonadota bacterium]|uniref:YbaN family protein n=1 Tax=Sphingomonas sp. ERG5 TaxID=1381597 RepID=UPI00054B7259|nr:YbaN family protein [Sphingomonas sp. ERG5]
MRTGWLLLGLFFCALGIIGALVPLMPTTIFIILAAGCFTHSSPRLEAWLLDHRRFGPLLRAWRREKAIPRRAKIAALTGMALGFAVFLLGIHPSPVLALLVALLIGSCALYVATRPEPRERP